MTTAPGAPGATTIDVIIAVRNEESTIPEFIRSIRGLGLPDLVALRMVFVEDSSVDHTREVLARVAGDPDVDAVTLTQGYGQCPALCYGASRSDADAVILMDVDGSHPIAVIPRMIRAFQDGAVIVQCRRTNVAAGSLRRGLATAAFRAVCWLMTGFDFERQNVYFRLIRRDVLRQLLKRPEWWRFLRIPAALALPGPLVELPITVLDRTNGASKYDLWRLLGFAADGVVSVMPPSRLCAVLAVCVGWAVVLTYAGDTVMASIGPVAGAWLGWRYAVVRSDAVPRQIEGSPIRGCHPRRCAVSGSAAVASGSSRER